MQQSTKLGAQVESFLSKETEGEQDVDNQHVVALPVAQAVAQVVEQVEAVVVKTEGRMDHFALAVII